MRFLFFVLMLGSPMFVRGYSYDIVTGIVKCPDEIVGDQFNVKELGAQTPMLFTKVDRGLLDSYKTPTTQGTAVFIDYSKYTYSCTTNVTNMENMFNNTVDFNNDISSWDTSNVINMNGMFMNAITFNKPISNWNTSSVTNMDSMFHNATAFNQNLTKWCVNITKPTNFATNSPLANANIALLPLWNGTGCKKESKTGDEILPFFCIIISNQTVSCWGDNTFGQLGIGNNDVQNSPVLVKDLFNIVKVSVGAFHACAINSTGSTWCWGRNTIGLLGIGNTNDQNSPVLIENLINIVDISVGKLSSCAIDKSGNGWLWGYTYLTDRISLTGNEKKFITITPTHSSSLSNVLEFSVGFEHICMLKNDGFVYCWGSNYKAQLGKFNLIEAGSPLKVEGLSNIVEISSDAYTSCARNTTGSLFCWGPISMAYLMQNINLTALNPNSDINFNMIVEMSAPGHSIIEMSASFTEKYFLTKDGQVLFLKKDDLNETYLWEYGLFLYPVKFSNVVKIYSGPSILCAINTTGSVSCDGLPLLNQPLNAWVSKESPTTEPTTEPTTTSGKETMIIIIVSVVSGIIILIGGFLICRR